MTYGLIPRELTSSLKTSLQSYTSLSEDDQASLKKEVLSFLYEPTHYMRILYGLIGLVVAKHYASYKPGIQMNVATTVFGAEFGYYSVLGLSKFIGANYHPSVLEESIVAGLGGYASYEFFKSVLKIPEDDIRFQQLATAYNVYTALSTLIPFAQKILASKSFAPETYNG